ncbi:hypothetical protein [Roseibium sp. MMSF_3412]|uniref:hypothetical protein n=1 Tax=Roseibium sp. MMSF_3412 TaxID=3046712 RepID=UPI00273F335A|nr:hypothetical protein [Roseibium sp. MMSF_3412]
MLDPKALLKVLEDDEAVFIDRINEIKAGRARFWSLNVDGDQVETTEKDLIYARQKLDTIQPIIERLKKQIENEE